MPLKLYSSLASWWPLMSHPDDYAEEAAFYWRLMCRYAGQPIETLLELGCGGGNNAVHLKQRCRMTLSDISPQMLEVSRALNPECEHIEDDMRELDLARSFDAVFVHDAVMYMRTERQLRQAMTTAFEHCSPGGVAVFAADYTRETWSPSTSCGGHDGPDRSMRYLEWYWDPDPTDTEYIADMIYLLRQDHKAPRVEQDRHHLGLFPRETWLRLLEDVGFQAIVERCRFDDGDNASAFVGTRAG